MTTLIVPGLYGSGPGHWQHRWLAEIDDAVLVEQRDWARPDRDEWLARLTDAVIEHPGALLVGHSLGAVLIAHLAAERPDLPIGGALLVAPADVDGPRAARALVATFAPLPTRPFAFPSILVASRNDAWMTIDKARVLANLWESSFIDVGEAGHINAETGLGGWELGRALLARLDLQRRWQRPSRRIAGRTDVAAE